MDLSHLPDGEANPVYRQLAVANTARLHDFLKSLIEAAVVTGHTFVSHEVIKALNFHAIVGLHANPGEYRSEPVRVGSYRPPPPARVKPLMDEFVDDVNAKWKDMNALELAAYAVWRVNNIHPFINGNGRTSRTVGYFVLCLKVGGALPGAPILPEVLGNEPARQQYVDALKVADADGNLTPLTDLLGGLLEQQLASV